MEIAPVGAPPSAAAKAQAFAHRVIEFAEYEKCVKFFDEKEIDFDLPTEGGWTLLMSVVASARVELIGLVMDRTTNVESGTVPNGATVLHMAATSSNPQVIQELAATDARVAKLRAIANACNTNGDTPLMMACVAKNVAAVQILLEKINAFPSPSNSSGMTALMCACRLQAERDGPSFAAESDAIVALMLAHGADVNAATLTGRQTALHVALDSCNVSVLQQLIAHKDIDFNVRNKAGDTPLRLARRLKLDSLMNAAVQARWEVVDDEANEMSEKLARELADAVAVPQTATSKKSKKTKAKKTRQVTTVAESLQPPRVESADEATDSEAAEPIGNATRSTADLTIAEETNEEWATAATKKSKRKETPPPAERPASKPTTSRSGAKSKSKSIPHKQSPAAATTEEVVKTRPDPALTTPVWVAPLPAVQPSARPVSPPSSPTPTASYDSLNAIFHRTFPIADEMDINVESFLAGAATTDAAEVLNGLSVSQVEILQEAHLQAYQFLNERKLELVRELEAQRLEAQMELRRKILEMP